MCENTQIAVEMKRSEVNDQFYVKLLINLNVHLQKSIVKKSNVHANSKILMDIS